jgi:uncharacterized protein YndB with AHSA1/START domain
MSNIAPARCLQVELSWVLAVSPDRAWAALVRETDHWWPKDLCVGPARAFRIEPRVGGRVFEDWGGQQGALWGTVIVLHAPQRLEWVGALSPDFGGPATSIVRIDLQPHDQGCTLSVRDAVFGRVGPRTGESLRSGWQVLLGEAFKRYAEARGPKRQARSAKGAKARKEAR